MGSSALGEESGVVNEIGNVATSAMIVIKWRGGLAVRRCMMRRGMKENA